MRQSVMYTMQPIKNEEVARDDLYYHLVLKMIGPMLTLGFGIKRENWKACLVLSHPGEENIKGAEVSMGIFAEH